MKEYIQNSIDNFLNTNHYNRALFINGTWGSGKTHFIKNELKSYLKLQGNDLIYITLNGIESLVSLKKAIIVEAISNSNTDSKSGIIAKGVEKAKRLIGYVDKADVFFAIFDLRELVKIDKTIICFDDLERISDGLKIDDVLGLINTQLIENNISKVILVGDTSKNQLGEESFEVIKEKYISWTIKFEIDKKVVINSITELYKNERPFYEYLKDNNEYIIELCTQLGIHNFRTVQFAIETLRILFVYHIPDYERIDKDIIYFAFVISTEYKSGNLKLFDNVHQLPPSVTGKEQKTSMGFDVLTGQLVDESKSKKTDFQSKVEDFESHFQKYISWNKFISDSSLNINYIFIEPIYTLITTGYLNQVHLNQILSGLLKLKKNPIVIKRNELLLKLSNFSELSEIEIDQTYNDLRKDIESGSLTLSEFAQAINLLLWLSNRKLILISHAEIEELCIANIDKITFKLEAYNEIDFNFGIEYLFRGLEDGKHSGIYKVVREKYSDFETKYIKDKILNDLKSDKDYLQDQVKFSDAINELDGVTIGTFIVQRIRDRQFIRKVGDNIVKKYSSSNSGEFYFDHINKLGEIFTLVGEARNEPTLDRMDKYFIDDFLTKVDNKIIQLNKTHKEQ